MNCTEITMLAPLYLSGEMEATRAAEFKLHLEECSSCAREMEHQREFDARIREGLAEKVETTALVSRIRGRISAQRRWRQVQWLAAACAIVIAVIGWRLMIDRRVPLVCIDAAEDHRDEVIDRRHRNWTSDAAALSALAHRIGFESIDAPALAPAGYRFEHGKLCRLDGHAFVHLVYANGNGEVSIFLRPRSGATKESEAEIKGEHVASLHTDKLIVVAVTMEPGDAARRMAQRAASAGG